VRAWHHEAVPTPLSDDRRQKLRDLSQRLLRLHKALLEVQRRDHDAERLPVRSRGELLQLVLQDPEFAWLRTLSSLIVQVDELVQGDELATDDDASGLIDRVRALIQHGDDGGTSAEFGERYKAALQSSPDVVIAHGAVVAALG
jgi:hypothetical protein